MMKRFVFALAVVALAATLAAPAAGKKQWDKVKQESHESYDVGQDGRLTLGNINGDVTVTGYDGGTIEVDITRYASSQERMDAIDITSALKDGHLTIKVEMDGDWHDDGHASVNFRIRVPKGTRLDDVELVNGDLALEGISGRVEGSSVNGDVTAEHLGGDADLSAVNGDVYLAVAGAVTSIKLNSVNGTVELVIPRDANARVSASTVHGSIRGTGEIKVEKNFVGSSLSSVLGNGEGRIDLETVNGNIRISHGGDKGRG